MPAEPKVAGRPIWMEVHTGTLEANLRSVRKYLNAECGKQNAAGPQKKPVKILAVVKGNGYGHGTVQAAKVFARGGADWFGVTSADEGAELREGLPKKPILVLTGFWPGEEQRIIEYGLTPAVTDCTQLRDLERAAARSARSGGSKRLRGPLEFHLKIDSGMNRLGIAPKSIGCIARTLEKSPHLRMTGAFTHLASSEDFTSSQSDDQLRVFQGAIAELRKLGISPGLVHIGNSAAVVFRPDTWADMVRPGALIYGYHQRFSPAELRAEAIRRLRVEPAIHLCARVVALKDVAPGEGVGYNARYRATERSRIAIICAGYADGLPRTLSNKGRMIVRGQFAPIAGIVSMDLTAVDVTGVEGVQVGDIATIYGPREANDAEPAQAASDVAKVLGTATSELTCAISKRVPRVYLH